MPATEDGTKEYWTTLRSLSSVSAESAVPQASGFVTLDWSGPLPEEVEIRFDPISTTGSPDEVIYRVWRNLGGKVDKISSITILASDFSSPIPTIIRFDGGSLWVTVSFTGGAGPTVTNLVQYRVIK
jgi:hypothetical protein